jgi:formylmethanofuran dehydrogenase subunit B
MHPRTLQLLAAARRVLVTGLVGAPLEAVRAGCDIAEALGAAIAFGAHDLDRPAGPTIARAGSVTADPGEMLDRADLVILWGCDPAISHPALAEFVPPRVTTLRMPPAITTSVDAARLLQHLMRGGEPPAAGGPLVAACVAARAAIDKATCVAIVTDDSADLLGLEAWAITHLVREIAHVKPAFEIPVQAADHAAAAGVCTWRYGAAGAITRADREGGRFQPGEASARQLVARGEVDCVIAIGRLADEVEEAIARHSAGLTVIRMPDDVEPLRNVLAAVATRTPGGDR